MATPQYENLDDYFDELRNNPTLRNTLRRFFSEVPADCSWCLLYEPHQTCGSKEAYSQRFQESSKFVNELLSAFGFSPVCGVCPGQDSRTTYNNHVCGTNHFKYFSAKLSKDIIKFGPDSVELYQEYEQSWTFVLGEMRINYLTGELRARRRESYVGIQVLSAKQLPTEGEWYCVGTQVAVPLYPQTQGPEDHWTNKWPTTNGGKPRWKTMIRKPAERLVELLEAHGIHDHTCPICENPHGLWANHLGGPTHYKTLYNGGDLEHSPLRWQMWDLPDFSPGGARIIGQLGNTAYPFAAMSSVVPNYNTEDVPRAASNCQVPTFPCSFGAGCAPGFAAATNGCAPTAGGCPQPSFAPATNNCAPSGGCPQPPIAPATNGCAPTPAPGFASAPAGCAAAGAPVFSTAEPHGCTEAPADHSHGFGAPPACSSSSAGAQKAENPFLQSESSEEEESQNINEIIRRCQAKEPRTLYKEYADPDTGNRWWYDLVTREALFSYPSGTGFVILS